MTGAELRSIFEGTGLKHGWVAERAGYSASHLSKIFKPSRVVATDELERIAPVLGHKPGDLLENSLGDLRPVLPIVQALQRVHPDVLPRIQRLLDATVREFEEMLTGREMPAAGTPVEKAQIQPTRPNGAGSGFVVEIPTETRAHKDRAVDASSEVAAGRRQGSPAGDRKK